MFWPLGDIIRITRLIPERAKYEAKLEYFLAHNFQTGIMCHVKNAQHGQKDAKEFLMLPRFRERPIRYFIPFR
jgi:hypothetical protein